MRIGSSAQLPPHLPSPAKRQTPVAPVGPQQAGAERPALSSVDWSERARKADSSRFYSTDRQLPFSGQAAIATYLSNANLNWQPGDGELLGIDLYA